MAKREKEAIYCLAVALVFAVQAMLITSVCAMTDQNYTPPSTTTTVKTSSDPFCWENINASLSWDSTNKRLTVAHQASSTRSFYLYSPNPTTNNGTFIWQIEFYQSSSESVIYRIYDANGTMLKDVTRSTQGSFRFLNLTSTSPDLLVSIVFPSSSVTVRVNYYNITSNTQFYEYPISIYGSDKTPLAFTPGAYSIRLYPAVSTKFNTYDGTVKILANYNIPIPSITISSVNYLNVVPGEKIITGLSSYSVYVIDNDECLEAGDTVEAYVVDLRTNATYNAGSGKLTVIKSTIVPLCNGDVALFVVRGSNYTAEHQFSSFVDSNPLYVAYSCGGRELPIPEFNPISPLTGNLTINYDNNVSFGGSASEIFAHYSENAWIQYAILALPLFFALIGGKYMSITTLAGCGFAIAISTQLGADIWLNGALGIVAFICVLSILRGYL